jgi:hypothetical protein
MLGHGWDEQNLVVPFVAKRSLDPRHEVRVLRRPFARLGWFNDKVQPVVFESLAGQMKVDVFRFRLRKQFSDTSDDIRNVYLGGHYSSFQKASNTVFVNWVTIICRMPLLAASPVGRCPG